MTQPPKPTTDAPTGTTTPEPGVSKSLVIILLVCVVVALQVVLGVVLVVACCCGKSKKKTTVVQYFPSVDGIMPGTLADGISLA